MKKIWIGVIAIFMLHVPIQAAQLSQVDVKEAEVYADPDARSNVVGKLIKNQYVAASNLPTRGFYKVRMPDGTVGWVSAEVLVLNPDVEAKNEEDSDGSKQEENDKELDESEKLREKPKLVSHEVEKTGNERDRSVAAEKVRMRANFLLGFLSWTDFTSVTAFEAPASIKGASFDLEIFFLKSFSFLLRGEYLFGGVDAVDGSNKTYTFSLSSLPVYGGLGFTIGKERPFNLGIAVLAGIALNTQFSSTSLTDSAPNETIFKSSPVTILVKAHLTYFFNGNFGLSGEIGYRMLSTDGLTATTSGNGSNIFTAALPINYGGLYFSAGFGLKF